MTRRALRRSILTAARELAASGLVAGTVGNVSARTGRTILITPTRMRYAGMRGSDIVAVDLDGRRSGRNGAASIELPLHLAIYRARPDVGAVVHTHSPYATAWSFLGENLKPAVEETTYYGIGSVRTARPTAAGSSDLAAHAAEVLGSSKAVLLGRHGVVAVGESVERAVDVASAVEHQAHVAWLLRDQRIQHHLHATVYDI